MAKRIGVTKATVSRWETGTIPIDELSLKRIVQIANILHIEPSLLVETSAKNALDLDYIDIKDLVNNKEICFEGDFYHLNNSDKKMLINVIRSVLQGKEVKKPSSDKQV